MKLTHTEPLKIVQDGILPGYVNTNLDTSHMLKARNTTTYKKNFGFINNNGKSIVLTEKTDIKTNVNVASVKKSEKEEYTITTIDKISKKLYIYQDGKNHEIPLIMYYNNGKEIKTKYRYRFESLVSTIFNGQDMLINRLKLNEDITNKLFYCTLGNLSLRKTIVPPNSFASMKLTHTGLIGIVARLVFEDDPTYIGAWQPTNSSETYDAGNKAYRYPVYLRPIFAMPQWVPYCDIEFGDQNNRFYCGEIRSHRYTDNTYDIDNFFRNYNILPSLGIKSTYIRDKRIYIVNMNNYDVNSEYTVSYLAKNNPMFFSKGIVNEGLLIGNIL